MLNWTLLTHPLRVVFPPQISQAGSLRFRPLWMAIAALLFVPTLLLAGPDSTALAKTRKNVLVIYPKLVSALEQGTSETTHLFSETFDPGRFSGPEKQKKFSEYLAHRYHGKKIDAVIAMGGNSKLVQQLGKTVFPNAKVATCNHLPGLTQDLPNESISVDVQVDYPGTIALALRLQPRLREIAWVIDDGPGDDEITSLVKAAMAPHEDHLRIRLLRNDSLTKTINALKKLGPDSAVIYTGILSDSISSGKESSGNEDILPLLAEVSAVPAYCFVAEYLEKGFLGGSVVNTAALAQDIVFDSLNSLADESSDIISAPNSLLVNWEALQRWKIPARRVPSDAKIVLRPPGIWETHRNFLIGAIVVCSLQTVWILILLRVQRARRKAENSLRESEDRMSLAAVSADLGMWSWDLATHQIWATPQARTLLSLPSEGPLNSKIFFEQIHPDDKSAVQDALQIAIQTGGEFAIETRIARSINPLRWLTIQGNVPSLEAGRARKVTGVALDITHRKSSDLRIERQREDLASLSRISLMGEMATSLAHEINQPLATIVTSARAGESFLAAGNTGELRETLDDIAEAGLHAGEIIKSLRRMVERSDSRRQVVQLNQVLADAMRLARLDAKNRGFGIEVQLSDRLPGVRVDPIQIQQVILNLIINAFDAADGLPQERRRIIISTQNFNATHVAVTVRDFGPGFTPPNNERQLFQRLFTTKSKGLGLGLYIARSILKSHDGTLETLEDISPGSCFRFTLPIYPPPETNSAPSLSGQ